ncbi:macrophage mannose receptor 1-like isoform X2 [Channa argus]|uniref:macrophage mannose receptor 1-like isoform X2 n=1 Tax=Channa argus TaxID=215402 RepID=UPI003520465A
MDGTVGMMVLSGLCFLPSYSLRLYILVTQLKTWTDAQSYCRSMYTDLATVQNEEQLAELNQLIGTNPSVWIGLSADTEAWRWSLENQAYYGKGEADFRMWNSQEPNGGGYYKVCVAMATGGTWTDQLCINTLAFICYNGKRDPSSSFILVNQFMTWMDAQSYCRLHHTDLASVRNKAENDQIKMMLQSEYTWIGLFRDSWKWSDGSPVSFSYWDPDNPPSATSPGICVASNSGKWKSIDCSSQNHFACIAEPVVRKLVVQVELEKSDSSVDMEDLKDILQQFHQRLNKGVQMRWVEHPNGEVFQKKTTDTEEKNICTLE